MLIHTRRTRSFSFDTTGSAAEELTEANQLFLNAQAAIAIAQAECNKLEANLSTENPDILLGLAQTAYNQSSDAYMQAIYAFRQAQTENSVAIQDLAQTMIDSSLSMQKQAASFIGVVQNIIGG